MKLWIDDCRPAPPGYCWIKSVNTAKEWIMIFEARAESLRKLISKNPASKIVIPTVEVIDIDHNAGDYVSEGGNYIKFLNWLNSTGRNYPIRVHNIKSIGVENMH